ncbi:tryptophan synthase subunit alpha [Candidatus Sumerlaeota bacterium]|nr:tryptophan synthase subunit alpha [Candidatus Sumerlaeota bacterium]
MNRIEKHFAQAAEEKRKSLILFLSAGFPDLETTGRLIEEIDRSGCDVLELGVPFSDPIADGPTIQASSFEALKSGTTLVGILDLVETLRSRDVRIPILLFGAFNPFLHYGLDRLASRAVEAGVDGFLVPDLPIEEAEEFEALCRGAGLSLVFLVAPTTPPERMKEIAQRSTGFVYFVSLKGVTGVEIAVGPELRERVGLLRRIADPLPVAVGFGIQTPEHVRAVAQIADGVVVGSALVRLVDKHRGDAELTQRVGEFVRSLKSALS